MNGANRKEIPCPERRPGKDDVLAGLCYNRGIRKGPGPGARPAASSAAHRIGLRRIALPGGATMGEADFTVYYDFR